MCSVDEYRRLAREFIDASRDDFDVEAAESALEKLESLWSSMSEADRDQAKSYDRELREYAMEPRQTPN